MLHSKMMTLSSAVVLWTLLVLVMLMPPATHASPADGVSPRGDTYVPLEDIDRFLRTAPLALVAFYSPQCGACAGYMPEFDKAAVLYKNQSVAEFEAEGAATGADTDVVEEPVLFARVDISGSGPEVERAVKRFGVTKFPAVRVVVQGDQVSPVAIEEVAKTAAQIATAAHQIGRRFQYEGAALRTVDDVRELLRRRIKQDVDAASAGRTILIAKFDEKDRPSATIDGKVSACRNAFSAAMVALIEVPFLEVHVTFNDQVVEHVTGGAEHDITLPGWLVDPDEAAECSSASSLAIAKCGSTFGGECRLAAAHLPMPASAEQMLRMIAVHALPPVVEYEAAVKTLIEKSWMDVTVPLVEPTVAVGSGVPPSKRGQRDIVAVARHDELRSARRTRPVLVYFTQVKNCGENTTEARTLRYLRRTLRNVAFEFPNISFVIADSYEYNTLFLRFGFRRHHARDNIVFGVIDGGRRFSSLPMNFSAGYSADKVRQFLTAFNNGAVKRTWKSAKGRHGTFDNILPPELRRASAGSEAVVSADGKSKADGLRVVSARDLERALFRLDGKPTADDRRMLGGRDDVALVLFAHQHCHNCRALVRRFAHMARAQQELVTVLDDVGGSPLADGDIPSMFLSTPEPSSAPSATAADDDDADLNEAELERKPSLIDDGRDANFDVNVEDLDEDKALEKFVELTVAQSKKNGVVTALGQSLRRISFFVVNASENDTPSEHWMPDTQMNVFPVIAAVHRTSRIAYDRNRISGDWDVTVRSPVIMDLLTKRYGDSGPRELRLLDFADKELRAGKRLGQRFVRSG